MTIYQKLLEVSASKKAEPALFYLEKPITYQTLTQSISRLSYLFLNELGPHQTIAFLTSPSPSVIAAFFAFTNTCSKCLFIPPHWEHNQIGMLFRDLPVTALAITSDKRAEAQELISKIGSSIPIVDIEKKKGGEYDTSFSPSPEHTPSLKDTVLLIPTRGYEEKPKWVPIHHKHLIQSAQALKALYQIRSQERFLTQLSWSLPYAFFHGALFPLLFGSTTVVPHGLEEKEFISFLQKMKISRWITHPKETRAWLKICQISQITRFPYLKSITISYGLLSKTLEHALFLLETVPLHTYGLSETTWTIAMESMADKTQLLENFQSELRKKRSLKKSILPSQKPSPQKKSPHMIWMRLLSTLKAKVINVESDPIDTKKKPVLGRLCVSGPTLMNQYWHKNKKIAQQQTRDTIRGTWIYTEDLTWLNQMEDPPRIAFVSRAKDVFFKKPPFLFPQSIEPALKKIPEVIEGVGFLTEDHRGKPMLACAIERAPKSKLSERDVLTFLEKFIPQPLMPKQVIFLDKIPKDLSGNPLRKKLRILLT